MQPAEAVGLAGILVPIVPPMNESEAAGLPKDFKAYRLNMQQSWLLALINADTTSISWSRFTWPPCR